jgi:transposase-like protein
MKDGGATIVDIARHFGVSRETVYQWFKEPPPTTTGAEMAKAVRIASSPRPSVVVPIRAGVEVQAPLPVVELTRESLLERSVAVLQQALDAGDAATARWVAERVDPEAFGTATDKRIMADLRKAADAQQGGRVVVTIGGTKPRKQAAG